MLSDETGREDFVDAVVSGMVRADDRELIEEAAAAGENLAEAAADLRARFLERVAAARAPELDQADLSTLTDSQSRKRVVVREDQDCPRTIGRYPILRRLGAGGMGVVYAAYDELLDRRLAIKVLHDHVWDSDGRRRERLLREAQAMARVTHPNVVTVHEVGTVDDQLFVAMEFVAGPTLREWLTIGTRSWKQVIAVFRQIADGLAALHEAGLVHRDVKPTNILIGDDGRVRVLDLGLASSGGEVLTTNNLLDSSSSLNRIDGALTRTGERVGTPAYMSREQFLGLELTPASDIFSFSVALFEALYGIHPFFRPTFAELQANVMAGRIASPPNNRGVPAWLHALVLRGLASDPNHRPPSMQAISAELSQDPSRARRRWIGSIATVGLAAVVGVLVARAQGSSAPSCDGGESAIATVWSSDRADRIRAAIVATDRSYAPALAARVTDALDAYSAQWATTHNRICREHARGEHSDALLDARMACLDRRRQAFAETAAILTEADLEVVDNAGQMIAKLPRLEPCDDLARLLARPTVEPALAPMLAGLELRLVRAEALAHAGRTQESIELARAVAVEAEALELPGVVASALLGEARASILSFDRPSLAVLLGRALEIAIVEDLNAVAAEAMIRRLYARGLEIGGSEAALADVPLAEAMLVRAGDDPELRALLLNNLGAVHAAAGQREAARDAFARSLAINERLYGEQHLELAVSLANLGMLTADSTVRAELHRRMIDIYERRLGPDHPRTLDAGLLAAFHTEDPEQAGLAYERLCPRFVAIGELRFAGECELERGRTEHARGRGERAREAFMAARDQIDDEPRRISIDAYLSLAAADPRAAIASLGELVVRVDQQTDGDWWVRLEQSERRLLLAQLRLRADQPGEAVDALEQALVDLEAIAEQAQPIERERLLAATQLTLARALIERGGDQRPRVAALLESARAHYQRWPEAYASRLDELAALASLNPPTDESEPSHAHP